MEKNERLLYWLTILFLSAGSAKWLTELFFYVKYNFFSSSE